MDLCLVLLTRSSLCDQGNLCLPFNVLSMRVSAFGGWTEQTTDLSVCLRESVILNITPVGQTL